MADQARAEPSVDKPALLFICQRLPYPPNNGERITTYNFLRHLITRYRVFVGTFSDRSDDRADILALEEMVAGLCVVRRGRLATFATAFLNWLAAEPASFAVFRSRRLSRWANEIIRVEKPVVSFAHSSSVSTYAVDRLRRQRAQSTARIILHFADVDSLKFAQYGEGRGRRLRWFFAEEARRVRREERRLAALADVVALVSNDEADVLRTMLPGLADRIVTLPNGVDTEVFRPEAYPAAPFERTGPIIAFTGAMSYAPNVEAVTWFVREVFPGVRATLRDAQFLIVGSNPTRAVQQLASVNGVTVTGRVTSAAAFLAHADMAVAPLRIARGVQNKVLEAMAMGIPTVVSSGALTGIDAIAGTHLLLADQPADWVEACVRLALTPDLRLQLGLAARDLVARQYSWSAQFERLDSLLKRRGDSDTLGVRD
jgi:sugar transferase (PEP-CTERM/EpsH1 system associated)